MTGIKNWLSSLHYENAMLASLLKLARLNFSEYCVISTSWLTTHIISVCVFLLSQLCPTSLKAPTTTDTHIQRGINNWWTHQTHNTCNTGRQIHTPISTHTQSSYCVGCSAGPVSAGRSDIAYPGSDDPATAETPERHTHTHTHTNKQTNQAC